MSKTIQNNIFPFSVKGKKKVLTPLNLNKNLTSISTNQSLKDESKSDLFHSSNDKFEINCINDEKEDAIFLSKLSEREKFFYEMKATDIYEFLKSINLIRFIDSFIKDGFESKEDLMEIQEDYFQENRSFNKVQQKKILMKAKQYLDIYNQENNIKDNLINKEQRKKNEEIINGNLIEEGVGNNCINDYYDKRINNRCWTCFKEIKDKNIYDVKYDDSIVTKNIKFCSESCKNKFELNIYTQCEFCLLKYDKSKGDYIYNDKHFHSQHCLDNFISKNIKEEYNNNVIGINDNFINHEEKEENIYDPMNDF